MLEDLANRLDLQVDNLLSDSNENSLSYIDDFILIHILIFIFLVKLFGFGSTLWLWTIIKVVLIILIIIFVIIVIIKLHVVQLLEIVKLFLWYHLSDGLTEPFLALTFIVRIIRNLFLAVVIIILF